MAGASTDWSTWEIAVSLLSSGGTVAAITALVNSVRKSAQNEIIATIVRGDLEKYRADTKEHLAETDKKNEVRFASTEGKIEAIRSDMATKNDLDRWGSMIQDSLRTAIAALGRGGRQSS
jgi:hypothetical protein